MTLPQNYARVLLTRAALLIGFGSLLLFTAQVVSRPAGTTTSGQSTSTAQQSPRTVTFEQTAPSTSDTQNTPTEPTQSPQSPSTPTPQPSQAPSSTTATGNTDTDSTSASVSCVNSLCTTSVTPQTTPQSPLAPAPSYHPCKVCNPAPLATQQLGSLPCPTIYCPD